MNTVKPAISGSARRGATLTAGPGTWTGIGNSTAYRWQRSRDQGATWETIAGATGATYALVVADVGAIVRVLVTTTNPEGSAGQASDPSAAVIGDGPVNTVAPALSGSPQRASTLSATSGSWSGEGNAYTYQWQRFTGGAWVNIAGATGASYELVLADVGATVRVLVTATNPDGSGNRASAPSATVNAAPPVNTSVPFITGATLRGNTLSAAPGTWTGPGISYAYQWQRDGVRHRRGDRRDLHAHGRRHRRAGPGSRDRHQRRRRRDGVQPRVQRRAGVAAAQRRRPDAQRPGEAGRDAHGRTGRLDADRARLHVRVAARRRRHRRRHERRATPCRRRTSASACASR